MTTHTPHFASHDAGTPGSRNPLSWWKAQPVKTLGSDCHELLKRTLGHFELLGVSQWRDAAEGDAIAAISIAIPAISDKAYGSHRLDLVMSCILLCVLNGNCAAAVVLAHALSRQNIVRSPSLSSSPLSLAAPTSDGDRS
jgi:hypothetical protein